MTDVKRLCRQKRLTGRALARLLKLSEPTVSRLLNGQRRARAHERLRIAEVLGMDSWVIFPSRRRTMRERPPCR
jgi:transcriptional regulator with XRE-family HTH domain